MSKSGKVRQMTKQQKAIYGCIGQYIAAKGYSPSVREICHMVGLRSTSSVHWHLSKLEEMGAIHKLAASPRTIVIVPNSPSEESSNRPFSLPEGPEPEAECIC